MKLTHTFPNEGMQSYNAKELDMQEGEDKDHFVETTLSETVKEFNDPKKHQDVGEDGKRFQTAKTLFNFSLLILMR